MTYINPEGRLQVGPPVFSNRHHDGTGHAVWEERWYVNPPPDGKPIRITEEWIDRPEGFWQPDQMVIRHIYAWEPIKRRRWWHR